jgi:hypothetical protein
VVICDQSYGIVFVKVLHGMKNDSDSVSQPPKRGDPQIPGDGARNQLVAEFSRLYAEAAPEDQFSLRVWMRDILLGRKEGSVNMRHARRTEKRMVEACERRDVLTRLPSMTNSQVKHVTPEAWVKLHAPLQRQSLHSLTITVIEAAMTSTIPISKVREQGASRDAYEGGRSLAVKKDGTVVAWGNWQKGSAPITSGARIGSATLVQKGQSRILLTDLSPLSDPI